MMWQWVGIVSSIEMEGKGLGRSYKGDNRMTRMGYRDRHDKFTLISCISMMMILVVAGYFIIGYGLNSAGTVEERDAFFRRADEYFDRLKLER